MTELPISPLARRIAEENNVNWRTLKGSSAEGSVNERDVLNYLEGVMLGTKPVDPTPEPLPEGMSAWAEEPVRNDVAGTVSPTALEPVVLESVVAESRADDGNEADEVTGFENAYRELFAELGLLKKAAADLEEDRNKERERAAQMSAEAQLELNGVHDTLTNRETELTKLRAHVAELEADAKAREQGAQAAQLELTHLRETLSDRDETLKAQLSALEAQAKELQSLAERLAKSEVTTQRAESEKAQLRAAYEGLEQTVAELKAAALKPREPIVIEPEKRPWWKLWG